MQKQLLTFLLLWTFNSSVAQSQQLFRNSYNEISFFSETPIENIVAKNVNATSLIAIDKNEIALRIPMTKFIFLNKRMQEHFQENYLETEQFPYATFRGKINETIDWNKTARIKVTATGTFTMHGITHIETIIGEISIVPGERLVVDANFEIPLARYNIEVPTLVWKKIAERIKVNAVITYLPVVSLPQVITQK